MNDIIDQNIEEDGSDYSAETNIRLPAGPTPSVTPLPMPLPTDFKSLLELLQATRAEHVAILSSPRSTASLRRQSNANVAAVGRAMHQCQLCPPAPNIDADDLARARLARLAGDETRRTKLAKLGELASLPIGSLPVSISENVSPQLRRVLADPGVQNGIQVTLFGLVSYALKYYENFDAVFPNARIAELQHRLSCGVSADERKAIGEELLRLQSAATEQVMHCASVEVMKSFELTETNLHCLVTVAHECAETLRTQAVEAEKFFFASQGVPHQTTFASRQWDYVAGTLDAIMFPPANASAPLHPLWLKPTNPESTVLTTFFNVQLFS
jgi:hypothetical protein